MGASRKLQGEIDRVLKKVQEGVDVFDSIWNKVYDTDNANQKEKFEADLKKEIKKLQRYRDQIKTWIQSSEIKDKKALLDARKLIEREMERFKVCEKETKTKAFSKEGLGQQPKTDPKEKAKSETRDWLNNVVGELESQIDNFEAEVEGLSVRKGKTRPPWLTHLETSIVRHKAHIIKLELILRLLENDELSPEQVNDVRDFLEDYVERNQEDFDEFSDVDELYNSLPLDKVDSLEDLVTVATPALIKVHGFQGVSSIPTASTVSNLKTSEAANPTETPEQAEETASQDGNSDTAPRTPNKSGGMVSSVFVASSGIGYTSAGTNTVGATPSTSPAILSSPGHIRVAMEDGPALVSSSSMNLSNSMKEDENASLSGRRSSPALAEIGIGKGIGRGFVVSGISNHISGVPLNLSSGSSLPSNGSLGGAPTVSDIAKRNILGVDERIGNGAQSPLSNRTLLQQVSRTIDGSISTDSNSIGESGTLGRAFSPSVVPGVQWRPQSPSSFQNQNEMGQFRVRTEIAPDQREKFLQRLQQVQQQGHSNLLGVPPLPGANNKQFPTQHQNSLLQQQQNALQQQSTQHALLSAERDADSSQIKMEDQLQQQNSFDNLNVELTTSAELMNLVNEDDLKGGGIGCSTYVTQVSRDIDLSSGQPLQLNQSSASLGVIGRRSVSDLGTIGDNLGVSAANTGGMFDQLNNLQMLEAAYFRLPQPKDSERTKNYTPRHPAKTPVSYPQVQAPIVDNPAFWERVSLDNMGTDTLFFAFYYQQNTFQQYLASRELKKQSWRYHRKYNTWFQRHEEPKVTTDEYEQGTYVYFDFYIANDDSRQGWCQRIKTEFTFEYSYLEDELVV